jgi:hypothetical protein
LSTSTGTVGVFFRVRNVSNQDVGTEGFQLAASASGAFVPGKASREVA